MAIHTDRQPAWQSEIQTLIERIRGVTAARVSCDEAGEIQEIHVVATTGRAPKQIVRDIESACAAQLGITLDHRKVSVAQLDDRTPAEASPDRPDIHSIAVESQGGRAGITVKLAFGEAIFEGTASGPGSGRQLWRVVALATAKALEASLHGLCRLHLESVDSYELGGYRGFTTALTMYTRAGEEGLVGAVIARKDDAESVAKAVMDAVNRRVVMVPPEYSGDS